MSLAKVSRIGPIGETYVDVLSKVYDLLEFFCGIQTPFGRVRAGATRLYHSPAPEIVMSCPETPIRSRARRAGTGHSRSQMDGASFTSQKHSKLWLHRVQSNVDSPTCDYQDHPSRSCAHHFHQRIYLIYLGDQLALFRCP